MKTKEFIRKVEELDFVGKAEKGMSGLIGIPNKNGEALASVNENLAYHFNTDYEAFRQLHLRNKKQLANIVVEYARTPLGEREEEKKYWYRLRGVKEGSGYLNYNTEYLNYHFTNMLEVSGVTTKFTDSEVKNFPDDIKNILMLCEKIEVTP